MAVSKVSFRSPKPWRKPAFTPMKALRQAPTAPPRPVALPSPSSMRTSASSMWPPQFARDGDRFPDAGALRHIGGLEADDEERLASIQAGA